MLPALITHSALWPEALNAFFVRAPLMASSESSVPPIDWDALTFSFTETDRMFVAHGTWEDGWSEGEMMDFPLM